MDKYVGNIVKTALIFATIGCLLSLAAPHIFVAVGLANTVGAACWTLGFGTSFAGFVAYNSLFFSGFGALSTAITPVVDQLFDKKPETHPKASLSHDVSLAPTASAQPPAPHREQETTPPHAAPETEPETSKFRTAELSKTALKTANHPGTPSLQ